MNAEIKEIDISPNYTITIANGFPTQITESISKTVYVTGASHYTSSGTIRDVPIKEALDLGILADLLIQIRALRNVIQNICFKQYE